MGLDYGKKRIGVAVSDELGLTAQGVTVINRSDFEKDIEKIKELISEYEISEIIVGIPKNMDGSCSDMALEASDFAERLKENIFLPLKMEDERLTSKAAERTLLEGDVSRKKRKTVIDKVAAVYLLQGYLDRKK